MGGGDASVRRNRDVCLEGKVLYSRNIRLARCVSGFFIECFPCFLFSPFDDVLIAYDITVGIRWGCYQF